MRSFVARAVALTLVLVGCSGGGPTDLGLEASRPALARQPATAAAPVSRPLIGRCETVITAVPVSPTQVRHLDTGTCWLTHLGRTTVFLSLIIDLANGTLVSEVLTYTAANGDVLRATIVGTFTVTGPTTVVFSGSQTFTGGTGRFAQATGSAPFEGTADLATNTSFYSFEGRIAYAASGQVGTE
jgi:hypothetical protein